MQEGEFHRLFAYDDWANRECLRVIRAGAPRMTEDSTTAELASMVGRMAHILSAQKLWLERIRNVPQSMAVWPGSTIEGCEALAHEMAAAWRSYLEKLTMDRLDEIVEYKNSKGERWKSRLQDVLTHVMMHSAYHRGQIALEMRAAGMEPAYTDFIHAVRQGLVG
ncbi:MAG: DinB family protein [Terriglobales bacterium]